MKINSLNQKNNPNFSANIEFCTLETVEKKLVRGVNVQTMEPEWGKKIGTSGILMCNAGGVTAGDTRNNLLFHLPGNFFLSDLTRNLIALEQRFIKTLNAFKQKNRTPNGLIVGGETENQHSQDLLVILKHLFDKYKIKHTIFWGTENSHPVGGWVNPNDWLEKNIFYDGRKDTWHVNLVKGESNNMLTKREVLDSFNYIRVSPDDRIKFSDTDWISGEERSLNKEPFYIKAEDVLKRNLFNHKIIGFLLNS